MMHRVLLLSAVLTAALLLLPLTALRAGADGPDGPSPTQEEPAASGETSQPEEAPAPEETPTQEEAPAQEAEAQAAPASPAEGRTVRLLGADGAVRETGLEDYLWGVVAAEMPAAFHPEALRAQAVAARTYALYRLEHPAPGHPEADLCCDGACCQAWMSREARLDGWAADSREVYAAALTAAVEDTRGRYLAWEGEPILAAFHSSSDGQTRSAAGVWGQEVPYLVSVSSPEGEGDAPNYYSVVTMTAREAAERLHSRYPGLALEGDCAAWFGDFTCGPDGLLTSLTVGGQALTAQEARELFDLRSASFTVSCAGEEITFYVTGYGHGVGMSQYGANVLAKAGEGWVDILAHYYPGTTLETLEGG